MVAEAIVFLSIFIWFGLILVICGAIGEWIWKMKKKKLIWR